MPLRAAGLDAAEEDGRRRLTRVLVGGASGAIGRAVVAALVARGHAVVAPVRRAPDAALAAALAGADVRIADVADPASLARAVPPGEPLDAVVSCLASRTGVADDAWAIDHRATVALFEAAAVAGARRAVLVSALCVQTPRLAFQHAKLAAEAALRDGSMAWTVVRPTAFFRSLSGQVERVRRGRPFLVVGDGTATACKPISDRDLAAFIADALVDASTVGRVLPIGGPGEALTPRDQAALLARLLGRPVPLRRVPARLLDAIAGGLALAARAVPRWEAKAELARIGRHYATHAMLVLDPATGRPSAAATPSTGRDTLAEHYAALLRGDTTDARGTHAVFE